MLRYVSDSLFAPSHDYRNSRFLRRDAQVISLVGLAHGTSHFFHSRSHRCFPGLKDAFAVSYANWLAGRIFSVRRRQALAGFVVDRSARCGCRLALPCRHISAGAAASQDSDVISFRRRRPGQLRIPSCGLHPAQPPRQCSAPRPCLSVHGLTGTLAGRSRDFLAGIATLEAGAWHCGCLGPGFHRMMVLIAFRHSARSARSRHAGRIGEKKSPGRDTRFHEVPAPVWMCFAFSSCLDFVWRHPELRRHRGCASCTRSPDVCGTACITAYMLASAGGFTSGGLLSAESAAHDKGEPLLSPRGVVSVLEAEAAVRRPVASARQRVTHGLTDAGSPEPSSPSRRCDRRDAHGAGPPAAIPRPTAGPNCMAITLVVLLTFAARSRRQ